MTHDRDALTELRRLKNAGAHVVLHYLYLATQEAAVRTAAELHSRGFETEHRLGADGIHWLVLARHKLVISDEAIAEVRRAMESLAQQSGGEYDGWEAEV